jgi:signal transduction histidine kinase
VRSGVFISGPTSSTLEAIAWVDAENKLNLVFDSRLPSVKKETQCPISLISQAQKSSSMLTNETAEKSPNDKFFRDGSHKWFIVRPIINPDFQPDMGEEVKVVHGVLFLEFSEQVEFSEEDFHNLDNLCLLTFGCLKSAARKKQLMETEQELAEARDQLFTYSRTLEQKIRMRTLELLEQTNVLRAEVKDRMRAQEEIAALQEKTANALRVKEQFLATMSHELRTPFNGVMGMIQLLQDTDLTDKQREHLAVLNSSSMNLLNLLNDILDYTKIESGHLEFYRSPLSIRDVCESVINEHFDNADEKGIDLAYISESDETDRIISDPLRLRQLIRCYVENAIKFNDGRGGHILLTSLMTFLREDDDSGEAKYRLSISCADTGPGITDVSELFVPFSQIDNSMRRRYGGTGLGLAITKRLVELLNGDAWCHSTVGQGSIFYFNMVCQVLY